MEMRRKYQNKAMYLMDGSPLRWQFKDENISINSAKGRSINCFGMITRDNTFEYATTDQTINANFIIERIDKFSYHLKKHTVILLDNAKIHQAKAMKLMQKVWTEKKLFIFYLPPYSPQLNIIADVARKDFGKK